jgi:hypothetical protein
MRVRWLWCIVLVTALAVCAGARVRTDLTYENTYRSYEQIFDNWTRNGRIYHALFSTRALFSATYFSLPMRRAFAAEWARSYDLPPADRDQTLADQLDQAAKRIEFVVCFYTPGPSFNDLEKADSSWRLWFIDARGVKVEAAKIEPLRVKHKKDYYFYPSYNDWSRLYRVSFPARGPDGQPLTAETGTVTLRVTGVEGMADLVWDIPAGAH